MAECEFCEIVAGRGEASIVHQDALVTAFLDIQPVNPGHLLIVPNVHAPYLADLEVETGAQIFRVAQQMAQALRNADIQCEGVNLFLADGEVAFQDVFHVHLHVIPRSREDGFGLVLPDDYEDLPSRPALDEIAGKIRAW